MENQPNLVIRAEVAPGIYQSRHGYHSCDYETYLLIKRVRKHYFAALKQFNAWLRWDRKQPQNRVIRKWKRNEKGQKIGCEIVGPKPEPLPKTDVFLMKKLTWDVVRYWSDKTKSKYFYGWRSGRCLGDLGILEAYKLCYPRATPDTVVPLSGMITKPWLNMILERLEKKTQEKT